MNDMYQKNDPSNKLQFQLEVKGLEELLELIIEFRQFKNEVLSLLNKNKKKTFTIKEAAIELRVSVGTINNKIKAGKLKTIQDTPKGVRTISAEELERYIREEESRYT